LRRGLPQSRRSAPGHRDGASPRRVRAPGPRALITGASSGVGRGYARTRASQGYDLVLVARDETRLRELAERLRTTRDTRVEVVVADLSTPDGIDAIGQVIYSESGDVLIINTG